jgi:transcriptional regulator with XRE-family HTH domain
MNTQQYLDKVRKATGFTYYRIAKNFGIPNQLISRYKNEKQTLSEKDAFVFAEVLGIEPSKIIADTKLENATIKNNTKKIAFWTHQVNRLKKGVASVFVFSFLALSPVDDVHANANDSTRNANFSIIYFMLSC